MLAPPDPSSCYEDDATIDDDEVLYRVVNNRNTKFANGVAIRGGSNAFEDYPAQKLDQVNVPAVAVSVYLASKLEERGLSAEHLLDREQWDQSYGVVSIRAGDARAEGQGIMPWPTPADPEHAMIFCCDGPRKTPRQSKALAKKSVVVIPPPQ